MGKSSGGVNGYSGVGATHAKYKSNRGDNHLAISSVLSRNRDLNSGPLHYE